MMHQAMHQRVCYRPPLPVHATSEWSTASTPLAQLGTILYHGPVPPAKGDWYGIEWDDPSRGKHSGVYDKTGQRYFETRVEGAGSFLRTDAKGLDVVGKTFIVAVSQKYLGEEFSPAVPSSESLPEEATTTSSSVCGSCVQRFATASNFDVEVVLNNRVTDRFKQLGRLREVGLEWENVSAALSTRQAQADAATERELEDFGAQLKNLEGLNMSYAMLPTLQEASIVAIVLPRLTRLSLNANRFRRIEEPTALSGFERLTTLQLNDTLMSWSEIRHFAPSLPNLIDLQFGYNCLRRLSGAVGGAAGTPRRRKRETLLPRLERLNLEANELDSWEDLVEELSNLPSLRELVLSDNHFESLTLNIGDRTTVSSGGADPPRLQQLTQLSLTGNRLASWTTSLDELGRVATEVFPALTSLRIADNPILTVGTLTDSSSGGDKAHTGGAEAGHAQDASLPPRREVDNRLLVIARLPFLTELEGTPVHRSERMDAERFWLERVNSGADPAVARSPWAAARLAKLGEEHADLAPATDSSADHKSTAAPPRTIKSRLLRLNIVLAPELKGKRASWTVPLELSVLPTLRTSILRTQISRLLATPIPKTKFRLVASLSPAEGSEERVQVEIPPAEENKEVSWWGLRDGDAVQILPL